MVASKFVCNECSMYKSHHGHFHQSTGNADKSDRPEMVDRFHLSIKNLRISRCFSISLVLFSCLDFSASLATAGTHVEETVMLSAKGFPSFALKLA